MKAISAIKGTRDFYPEDMAYQRWLYGQIRQVSELFGYQEYDGPYLERLELYAAKSGEELVREQSFVFEDRGGEMIALRPELTPSLARMVAARSQELARPLRWWSYGPFWRYERPQKGRSREFFQWNIDLMGEQSPQADAEIAAIAAEFFRAVGLGPESVRILVNDRGLAERLLDGLGIPADLRPAAFRMIDRQDRMDEKDWRALGRRSGLSDVMVAGLETIVADAQQIDPSAAGTWTVGASEASAEPGLEPLETFFQAATALGVGEYLDYDPSVVRGLDYYTGIVFEARDAGGEFRSILGGGRYDDLISAVGGEPLAATGFAMGDMVLRLVMEKYGALPELSANRTEVFIPSFDENTREAALQLASELRAAGLKVEWYPAPVRLPKQLKYADRQGIPIALLLGPDEFVEGEVAVKDLRTGEQRNVKRSAVLGYVRDLLRTATA